MMPPGSLRGGPRLVVVRGPPSGLRPRASRPGDPGVPEGVGGHGEGRAPRPKPRPALFVQAAKRLHPATVPTDLPGSFMLARVTDMVGGQLASSRSWYIVDGDNLTVVDLD